jgi:hypothetical protein
MLTLLAAAARVAEVVDVAQISAVFVEAVAEAEALQGNHLVSLLHPLKR